MSGAGVRISCTHMRRVASHDILEQGSRLPYSPEFGIDEEQAQGCPDWT